MGRGGDRRGRGARAGVLAALLVVMGLLALDAPAAGAQGPKPPSIGSSSSTADTNVFPKGTGKLDRAPDLSVPQPEVKAPGVPEGDGVGAGFDAKAHAKAKPVRELVDQRDRQTTVWLNDDGTQTRTVHVQPVNFQDAEGKWTPIDTDLRPDRDREGWFVTGANDWSASFGPIGPGGSGGVEIVSPDDRLRFAPAIDGDPIAPEVGKDDEANVVTYREVWPGVDVRYTVTAAEVKEDIVVREKGTTTFPFTVEGSPISPDAGSQGAFRTASTGDRSLRIQPPTVQAKDGRPVDPQAKPAAVVMDAPVVEEPAAVETTDSADDGTSSGADGSATAAKAPPSASGAQRMEVSIDPGWLGSLRSDQLPIVVDPTTVVGLDNAVSYGLGTSHAGQVEVGNSVAAGDTYWRAVFHLPFTRTGIPSQYRRIHQATLSLSQTFGAGSQASSLRLYWATDFSFAGALGNGVPIQVLDNPSFDPDFDVTNQVQQWVTSEQFGAHFGLAVNEGAQPGLYTLQHYDAALIIVENVPPVSATLNAPVSGQRVVTEANPTLSWTPNNTDLDGDPLKWWAQIATGPDAASGTVARTGLLDAGTTSWDIPPGTLRDGTTYYWAVFTTDQIDPVPSQIWTLVVDRRLSTVDASPHDQVGPIEANLVTGNASTSISTPSIPTLGGAMAASMTYNSVIDRQGLEGTYYKDESAAGPPDRILDPDYDDVYLRRIDPQVSFRWGAGAPTPALPGDRFLVQWNGFISVGDDDTGPGVDQWQLGEVSDDGIRVRLSSPGGSALSVVPGLDHWGASSEEPVQFGTGTPLQAFSAPSRIQIDYIEDLGDATVQLWAKRVSDGKVIPVPASWLTFEPRVLPLGWTLEGGDTALSYLSARVGENSITLYEPDGGTKAYKYNGSAYLPPEGEDDIVVLNPDGGVGVTSSDGYLYTFGNDGRLISVRSGADDRSPAAAARTFDSQGRLLSLIDPVGTIATSESDPSWKWRRMLFTYQGVAASGTCPSIPAYLSGKVDATAPGGMLCAITQLDGTRTELYYQSGALAWVRKPGDEYTAMAFSGSRLATFYDPLAIDMINAGYASGTSASGYVVGYGGMGVSSITAPEPTPGAARPQHTYAITHNPTTGGVFSGGSSTVTVAGISGVFRTVTYDGQARLSTDKDAANRTTTYSYLGMTDLVTDVQTPDGRKVHTTYDYAKRPTAVSEPYTGASPVGSTVTAYDEGMNGLLAQWWDNSTYLGSPKSQTIGVGDGSTSINKDWAGGAPPGISTDKFTGRLTGEVQIDTAGSWTFALAGDDQIVLYVDDARVLGVVNVPLASPTNSAPLTLTTGRHKIRIDFVETGGAANLSLSWTPPGGSRAIIPGSKLFPRLGLATSVTDPDGKRTETRYSSANGLGPQHSLPTDTVTDPASANLTETVGYEAPGSTTPLGEPTYFRAKTRTMPSGAVVSYDHYMRAELVAPSAPCSGAAANQGGRLKRTLFADPDGAGPLGSVQKQVVYDVAGRVVGQATFTGVGLPSTPAASDWVCTTYDARGRVASIVFPAYGTQPARTRTFNYAWNGYPSATLITDSGGYRSVGSKVDLDGRSIYALDGWNVATTHTYDQAGRLTSSANAKTGTVQRGYDAASQVNWMGYNGFTIASAFSYDNVGRLLGVTYPSGAGNAGNGTTGTFTYDAQGELASATWRGPGSALITSDVVQRSVAGRVWDDTVDGTSHAGTDFSYDGAGRLTQAYVNGRSSTYAFAASGSCTSNPTAGKDTNRTSQTITDGAGPAVNASYCYDMADRLTSSTDPAVGTIAYDSHGNTTSIFGETRSYDVADRHVSTTKGGTTITYWRDPTDRIVGRAVGATWEEYYTFDDMGDAPAGTLDSAANLIEADITLPGGGLMTTRSGGNVWSYPNVHGDLVATANSAGAKQGSTTTYDPYGNRVGAVAAVDNSQGSFDYGYLGQHQRGTEAQATLQPTIEMGARQYSPVLGRFLEVDPIEKGSANSYDYVSGDPINGLDLNGHGKPQPKRLTEAEREALENWANGLPSDAKLRKSARKKMQYNEKLISKERNAQKRNSNFSGPPDSISVLNSLHSGHGVPLVVGTVGGLGVIWLLFELGIFAL